MMGLTDRKSVHTGKRLYECDWCGKLEPWGPTWRWYGSYRDVEDDPASVTVFCSDDCQRDGEHNGAVKNLPVKHRRRA